MLECRCTPALIPRYPGRISGPLLDRIDLHIEAPAVPYKELRGRQEGAASSEEIRARVERVRGIQQARGFYNSQLPVHLLPRLCQSDDSGERTLELALRKMGLSARAHPRLLRVARTIAELDHSETLSAKRLVEAVQYRSLDRSCWS